MWLAQLGSVHHTNQQTEKKGNINWENKKSYPNKAILLKLYTSKEIFSHIFWIYDEQEVVNKI